MPASTTAPPQQAVPRPAPSRRIDAPVPLSDRFARSRNQTLISREDVTLLRDWRGWSMRELGERVGLSESYISRIEAGERPLDAALAIKFARALLKG